MNWFQNLISGSKSGGVPSVKNSTDKNDTRKVQTNGGKSDQKISSGLRNPDEYEKITCSNNSLNLMFHTSSKFIVDTLHFEHGNKIMDYGCGTGTFFVKYMNEIAKKKKLKLIGVDLSEEMMEYAKKYSNIPGITEYIVGNISEDNNWPFQSGTFDKIIALYVVHVVEDYKDLFCKFNKCLKIDGTFTAVIPTITLLSIFNPHAKDPFWSTKYECGGSQYFASWAQLDSRKEEMPSLEMALLSTGFKILEYHHYSTQLEFADIRECLGFLITVNGPLSKIPVGSDLYEKLMKDLIENARNLFGLDVEAKPFRHDWNNYWFTGEKIRDVETSSLKTIQIFKETESFLRKP